MLADHLVFPILLSKDLAASRAFYHDTLGLEILREDDERIIFRCGAGSQVSVTLSTVGTADSQTQLACRVPDIHAELTDLPGARCADRELHGARPGDRRRRDRRHGIRVGRLVHRSERQRAVGDRAEAATDRTDTGRLIGARR